MCATEGNRLFTCIHVWSFGSPLLHVQQSEVTSGLLCLMATSSVGKILTKYLLQLCLRTVIIILLRWIEVGNFMKYEIKKVWRDMSKPLSYIEACLLWVTAWLFFTYFINFICTNCDTHVEVKTLQKLLCLQWSKYFVIDKRDVFVPGIAEHLLKSQPTLLLQRTLVH